MSGGSGSGTLNGSVGTSSFTPQSATWTAEGGELVVYLWESTNACTKLSASEQPSGGYLRISISDAAGTYKVGTTASATYDVLSSTTCASTISSLIGEASSGSVTVSAAPAKASGSATGTFSLVFGVQTVTGSFDAAPCAVISDLSSSLTCTQ